MIIVQESQNTQQQVEGKGSQEREVFAMSRKLPSATSAVLTLVNAHEQEAAGA